MIVLNVYGSIEPTVISNKLGVGISNPNNDWLDGFRDDIQEEMLIQEHEMKVWSKLGIGDEIYKKYDANDLVKEAKWDVSMEQDGSDLIIAKNLICIDILDFENSYLQLKNNTMDSPTCEIPFPRKFIHFCNSIQKASKAKGQLFNRIPISIYTSDELNVKPRILSFFRAMIKHELDLEGYKGKCISSLKTVGALVDNFLQGEEDFWMLDYLINSLYYDREYNAYHVFKVMSLIEMLLINPSGNGRTVGELERKLPEFLINDQIDIEKRVVFTEIVRKLRNKIAHGDYRAIQDLLQFYRGEFMTNYYFDEFEYSVENWTYLNICCNLDEALNEIIWELITNRDGLRKIQYS